MAPRGGHRRRQRRIMHVLYVGAHGTAVALEDYAKDLRSRLRVDTKGPASRTASDCFPKIEAAETMLSRREVFEQIAARGGGNGATHLREICPLRERLRGFKSSQSVQYRLTS
jgi:hypothetical protein